jgi:integrase
MMARLGLRKNELRTLQWAGVDLERREIRIHGKGGKIADIPIIYDDLLAELAQLRDAEAPAPEDYLLYPVHVGNVRRGGAHLRGIVRSDRNQPMQPSTMHRWWKRCLGRADAPDFPMHELRHTAGTEFMRATGDLKLTQMFMRHASISTTADVYLHLDRADLIVGMKKAQERWQRQIDQEDKDEG